MPSPLDEAAVIGRLAAKPPGGAGPSLIVTPNLDHVVQLRRDPAFRAAYRRAVMILCDDFPVHYYARLHRHAVRRITGCGVVTTLLQQANPDAPRRLMFVVDRRETALAVQGWTASRGVTGFVATAIPPADFINDQAACAILVNAIAAARPDILIMGVGAPQSEIFIDRHRDALPDCWALCAGQGVKIALGLVRRAPRAVQRLHAEWLWRVFQEPRRLARRYGVGAFRFIAAVAADQRGLMP